MLLVLIFTVSLLAIPTSAATKVTLNVATMFSSGQPGNKTYGSIIKDFQAKNPSVTIKDRSAPATIEWITRIQNDFATGNEPDVMFFFNGRHAEQIVKSGKLVDYSTIRTKYSAYAQNLGSNVLRNAAASDGKKYCIPMIGFCEGIFYNKDLFAKYKVKVPTTWSELITAVKIFNKNGIVPFSASLGAEPQYYFDNLIISAGGRPLNKFPSSYSQIPSKWKTGVSLIKTLYDAKAFSLDAATLPNSDASRKFLEGKAAMYVDGTWFVSQIPSSGKLNKNNCDFISFPSYAGEKGIMVGGYSSGWYISKKAWNDPSKRDAAVKFVMANISDASISKYTGDLGGGVTASASAKNLASPLLDKISKLRAKAANIYLPPEDSANGSGLTYMALNMFGVAKGKMTAETFLKRMVDANNNGW